MRIGSILSGPKASGPVLALASVVCLSIAGAAGALWWSTTLAAGTAWTPQALARQSLMQIGSQPRSAANLRRAEALSRQELEFGPYRPAVWCRLAYIAFLEAGRLDDAAVAAARQAYRFGPYDPDVSLWRVQFILDNWTAAPADLKEAALREVRAYYSVWDHRSEVELMAARVRDPTGRLAIELVLLRAPMPTR